MLLYFDLHTVYFAECIFPERWWGAHDWMHGEPVRIQLNASFSCKEMITFYEDNIIKSIKSMFLSNRTLFIIALASSFASLIWTFLCKKIFHCFRLSPKKYQFFGPFLFSLLPLPPVVYFFQAGAPFSIENNELLLVLAIFGYFVTIFRTFWCPFLEA